MRLLGALFLGTFAFFAVGFVTGQAPRLDLKERRKRSEMSNSRVWLAQAGLDLTPRQFWAGSVLVGIVAFGIVVSLTAAPFIALVPGVAVGVLPRAYFSRKRTVRLREIQEAWPDAITEILAAIQSNSSLHGALVELSEQGPEVLKPSFRRFPALSSTLGLVPALEIIREELADPTSDRVIEVLILAHERGGGIITEILHELSVSTVDDLRVINEIETNALEQKINSRAVFVLPWLVLVMLSARPGPFRDFYRSSGGLIVVIAGIIISAVGMAWIAQLGKEPIERRVFGGSAESSIRGSGH